MDEVGTTAVAVASTAASGVANAASTVADAGQNVAHGVAEQTRTMLHYDEFKQYLTWGNLMKVITSVIAIVIFYIAYRVIKSLVLKHGKTKFQPHTQMIIGKMITYAFWIIIAMYVLSLFGIKLSAIWGAAGIAGLAIGFAAQTSVSNVISGLFVLSEKSLRVGDFISVAGQSGVVDSVGLLSVKIHTLDNQVIRIPNSSIINDSLENFSSNEQRRLVFEVPIDYECDLQKAIDTISRVPALCKHVLKTPEPAVFYDGFGDCGMNLKLAVWLKGSDVASVKNEVYIAIMKVCDEDKIEIPYTRYDIKLVGKEDVPATKKRPAVKAKRIVKKSTKNKLLKNK